jgi:ATP-dependent Zn protease
LRLILESLTKGDLDSADLSPVALRLAGGTGADCEKAVRGARQRARHAGRALEVADLMAEVGGTSGRKATRRTAVHEAAHAVVVALTRPQDLDSLSVIGRGGNLGGLVTKSEGISDSTEADVIAILRELLAGRAAEEVVFGDFSGGAGGSPDSDLARATLLALSCEASWGLGNTLTWFGNLEAEEVGRFLCSRPDISQRVERRLAAAYESTLEMVRKRQTSISALADTLLEREVLNGDEVRAILASVAEAARAPRVVGKRAFIADKTDGGMLPPK